MKRKTDLINRIRSMVTELSAQKTRLQVEDNIVEWSGVLQVGTELSAVEGNLPESFSLENGNVVTVEDGKVIGLTELTETEDDAEEVELEADEAEEEVELETAEEEVDEEVELSADEVEQRLATVESRLGELVTNLNELQNNMKDKEDKYSQLLNRVEELAKVPAVPAKKTEVSNNFNKTESRAAKVFASA